MKTVGVVFLALALVAVLPDVAHACPVCFDPNDENRFAFLATTIFLSLFPLSLVGATTVWLRKRSKQLDEEEWFEENRREWDEGL